MCAKAESFAEQNFDAVSGDITIVGNRSQYVDFTQSLVFQWLYQSKMIRAEMHGYL